MSYESFDDIKFLTLDLYFKIKLGYLVLATQEHTSGGYTFASGTDAGRPLSSFNLFQFNRFAIGIIDELFS